MRAAKRSASVERLARPLGDGAGTVGADAGDNAVGVGVSAASSLLGRSGGSIVVPKAMGGSPSLPLDVKRQRLNYQPVFTVPCAGHNDGVHLAG